MFIKIIPFNGLVPGIEKKKNSQSNGYQLQLFISGPQEYHIIMLQEILSGLAKMGS